MTQKYQVKVSMKQAAIVETGIVLKQGDFGMQLEIEVLDFDATGTTPQIVFRKAMGAVESTTITVSGNKYTYTFKGTELDTPGKVFCDLKLKNSTTQRISTASFIFRVVADTMDGLNEQASSYSDTIAQIVGGFDDDIAEMKGNIDSISPADIRRDRLSIEALADYVGCTIEYNKNLKWPDANHQPVVVDGDDILVYFTKQQFVNAGISKFKWTKGTSIQALIKYDSNSAQNIQNSPATYLNTSDMYTNVVIAISTNYRYLLVEMDMNNSSAANQIKRWIGKDDFKSNAFDDLKSEIYENTDKAAKQIGNNNTDTNKFNIWGSEKCPVFYGKLMRWLNSQYSIVTLDDPATSYGIISLEDIECRELVIYSPQVRPSDGQFILLTDETSSTVNITYAQTGELTPQEYWQTDVANHRVIIHAAKAKAIGYKKVYVGSGYETDKMYIYAGDFSYAWLNPTDILNKTFEKLSFEKVNIYKTKYTSDEIGVCTGYSTTTYKPTLAYPSVDANQARSRAVLTKVNINVPCTALKFEMPTKTSGSVTLTQAIILSGASSAKNITFASLENGYNAFGVYSDGSEIIITISKVLDSGFNEIYIAHIYEDDFEINALEVTIPWINTKDDSYDCPILNIPEYYHVTGSNSRIFLRNIVESEFEKYTFNKDGLGAISSRYIDYASQTSPSNYWTKIRVYGENNEEKGTYQFPVKAISPTAKTGQSIKIIMIGDSFIDAGKITSQLVNVAENGGLTIETIGTIQKNITDSDNESRSVKLEGRSGWASYDYRYTESFNGSTNAFLNNGDFDFSYYMTENGLETPDWVTIQLGINDTWRPMGNTTTIDNIKAMIESIKNYDANIKIGVATVPPPYFGQNHSISNHTGHVNRYRISKSLIEGLSNMSGVYIIPISAVLDTEYAFPTASASVGDWVETTIIVPTDETHPAPAGYYQIADEYFAALLAN